jgi:hypothetical protein
VGTPRCYHSRVIPQILQEPLDRWRERVSAVPPLVAAIEALPARLREELPLVVATSEFIGAALLQDLELLTWLAANDEPPAARR